jgi:hypothetical protein
LDEATQYPLPLGTEAMIPAWAAGFVADEATSTVTV